MPNATTHRAAAAAVVGGVSAYREYIDGKNTGSPLAHALLAWLLGTLPDHIEPAYHPNHRQFFHSWACAGLLGYGFYRLSQWETENEIQKLLKTLGLVGGGAYLTHLLMDATTTKSLPLA